MNLTNQAHSNFTLTTSSVKVGSMVTSPTVVLYPYSTTSFEVCCFYKTGFISNFTFQVDSEFGLNDRIDYEFGYSPITKWCSGNYTSGNQFGELTASFKYTYGDNSCDDSSVTCEDGSSTSIVYQNCEGKVHFSVCQNKKLSEITNH